MRDTREPRLHEVPLGGTLNVVDLDNSVRNRKRISTRCQIVPVPVVLHYISRPEIETAFSQVDIQ